MNVEIIYKGELRTSCEHLKSKQSIITDAPIDNNGKGEAFSPTDLVATALGSCILTIMGIKARDLEIDLEGTTVQIKKIMASEPRRISQIDVLIDFPRVYPLKAQKILEKVAASCPVAQSLHPDLVQNVIFNWKPE